MTLVGTKAFQDSFESACFGFPFIPGSGILVQFGGELLELLRFETEASPGIRIWLLFEL